jgi:hypothetical protein
MKISKKMLFKKKYFAVFFTILLFGQVHAQNDSIKLKSFEIGSKFFVNYLGFVKPNIAIVPCNGGAFSPNWHLWYLKTQDSILSVEPSYLDTSLVITRTSRNVFEIMKVSMDTMKKKMTPLVLTRGFVFYAVPSNFVKDLTFYVVGSHNNFNICQYYNGKVDTLFNCDKMINQLEVINQSTILFCYDNKLIMYPLAGKPSVLYQADKYSIYGFTSDETGGLYVSIDLGIIKINSKKEQTLISTSSIKGKLRYFNKELYILDAGNNRLFVIPLPSTNTLQTNASNEENNKKPENTNLPEILTNSSIIYLVKTKISDDSIIKVISSSEVNFNVGVDSMIFLSNRNVSSSVIMAMKNAMKQKTGNISSNITVPENQSSQNSTIPDTNNTGIKKFFIIAGSYPTEQQANDAVAELKRKEFPDAEVLGKNSAGSYRIAYKGYATNGEAAKDLIKIRQTVNSTAWIFETK